MANQTISVDRNIDDAAISGLANGEDITVNTGATLTINSDSRWGQQAAVVGNMTIDAGTGGTIRIDGRDVWWLPFDASTGNVPALGTAGVQDSTGGSSGATGDFLGVFTDLGVAPSTAASAMPANGFVKFRSKVGTFTDNEVVTLPGGATVTVNSTTGGQRGWLHIVGETATTISVPRLGLFEAVGDWFELGTTNGADSQTFQFPVADYCNAIQVETAPGSGVYEWWPSVGTTRWAQNNRSATDVRGKVCSCTAAGVIQIALRGAVNNGYKPATGCKVRIPNILVSTSSSANWALNVLYASNAAWDFTTTSAGAVRLDKTGGTWYALFSQAYSLEFTDSSFQYLINISENATAPILRRCATGIAVANTGTTVTFQTCFAGVTIEDCVFYRYEGENNIVNTQINDCDLVTITGTKFLMHGENTAGTIARGASTCNALAMARVTNATLTDNVFIGGRGLLSTCFDVNITGTKFAQQLENISTNATNGTYAFEMNSGCARCVVDGFSNYENIANVHPYLGLATILNVYDCEIRNVGTPSAPYNCGSANQMAVGVNYGGSDLRNIMRRVYLQNTRTGPFITLNSSSSGQAINVWGDGADAVAIANLNFAIKGCRFTGSTTGQTAVYGTHWADHFTSATVGQIRVHANEPTAFSASQCESTGGVPEFTSTGQVKLTVVGDQVTWTMPYFALGHTSLTTLTFTGTNQGNHNLEFQADKGEGMSAWQTLSNANLAAFGAIDPAIGVTLKIRATCTVANTGNQITYLTINTATDAVSQQIQYPLPGVLLTLSGLVPGSDIVILQAGTSNIIAQVDSHPSSTYVYDYTVVQNVDIGIIKPGYVPLYIRNYTLESDDSNLPVSQFVDRNYA